MLLLHGKYVGCRAGQVQLVFVSSVQSWLGPGFFALHHVFWYVIGCFPSCEHSLSLIAAWRQQVRRADFFLSADLEMLAGWRMAFLCKKSQSWNPLAACWNVLDIITGGDSSFTWSTAVHIRHVYVFPAHCQYLGMVISWAVLARVRLFLIQNYLHSQSSISCSAFILEFMFMTWLGPSLTDELCGIFSTSVTSNHLIDHQLVLFSGFCKQPCWRFV